MLTIRPMAPGDRDAVMAMVTDFYHSSAVEHQVDPATLERSFWDAADPEQPLIEGLLLLEGDTPVGYCYLTWNYASEIGERCSSSTSCTSKTAAGARATAARCSAR